MNSLLSVLEMAALLLAGAGVLMFFGPYSFTGTKPKNIEPPSTKIKDNVRKFKKKDKK